jgi:repressor LexA
MKRMENTQERIKTAGRRGSRAAADHQLDMFGAPAAPAAEPEPAAQPLIEPTAAPLAAADPQPRIEAKKETQLIEINTETVHQATSDALPDQPAPALATVCNTPNPITRRAQARSLPNRSLPALTRRQHDLLLYLEQRELRGERPPSLTEICRDLGLVSRGSLHKQVVALVQAGLVEPMNGKQRGVRLLKPEAANDDSALPMLGVIAAGQPIEALLRDESVVLPGWLRGPGGRYALRVRGDSMRDAGILDGDVVVIEPRQNARNGETVVALIDGESATLKRIEQRPGVVLLHAENPAFPPQRYTPEQVQIQGVVVAALRRYS